MSLILSSKVTPIFWVEEPNSILFSSAGVIFGLRMNSNIRREIIEANRLGFVLFIGC